MEEFSHSYIYSDDVKKQLQILFIHWFFETYKNLLNDIATYISIYKEREFIYSSSLSASFINKLKNNIILVSYILNSLNLDHSSSQKVQEIMKITKEIVNTEYISLETLEKLLNNFSYVLSNTFLSDIVRRIPSVEERMKRTI